MENLTGKQLGPYQIIAPLGKGGMAVVYKAYQPSMNRYVALKVLPRHYATDPSFVSRFEREAQVIANLEHLNILPVHDYGEAEGYAYLVMRFVEGGTLADLLHGPPLALPHISRLISQIAAALDYAHSRGVVHRDVKPGNVLIDEQGNCLLSDFGIAKMIQATTHFTSTGGFIGTPTYASPEQCLGRDLDGRSDIYSLGVMLYEMVTGRPPFDADTPMAIAMQHAHDPLPLPRTLNPTLPEAVERVILKALAKNPEERYQTADEMAKALEATARTDVAVTRPYPEQGRRIPAWGWALGGLVVLGILVGLLLLGGGAAFLAIAMRATATAAPVAARQATAAPAPTRVISAVTPMPTVTFGLSESPPTSGTLASGPHPVLVTGSGNQLHLAWADTSSGAWNVYYARSSDEGTTFSKPVPVGAVGGRPALAIGPDGKVHVAWEDRRGGNWDIYFARSDDGQTFSSPTRVSDDATGRDQTRPALAVGRDGNIHLVWQDGRNGDWDIYYARSTNGGASFSASVRVNTETRNQQVDPAVGVDSRGRVHVAWADMQSGTWTIYYARSEGESFSRGRTVGSGLMDNLANELPGLMVGPDDKVHIAWANAYIKHPTYGALLYLPVYAVSTDGGNTFSDPRQVGEGYRYVSVRSPETGLAADRAAAHVVLTTYSPRDGSWVWYYRSNDSGKSFSAGVGVQQAQSGDVLHYPVVTVDQKGRIHVAWAHQRGEEWDVYYAQSNDGGITFSSGTKLPSRQ